MGLFFRPRRPLLRVAAGAATAGVAYRAGRRRAQEDTYNEQSSPAYGAVRQQAPAAPPPPLVTTSPSAPPPDTTAQLTQLAQLHQEGSLSDEEFATAKGRLLGV